MPTTRTLTETFDYSRVQEDYDNYVNTVFAALALVNILRWDESSRSLRPSCQFGIGRRMNTSDSNSVSPNATVTPDVVFQNVESGVVGEITYSLSTADHTWREKLLQVRKYDDELLGWWTETEALQATHDLMLLVPQSRAVRVSDILRDSPSSSDSGLEFMRKTAVIGYNLTSGVKEFITLMKFYGDCADEQLSERLRQGIPVPTNVLIRVYHDRKFVDFEPPTPYLLQIMWQTLFPSYVEEFEKDATEKHFAMKLTVERITRDMQRAFGFEASETRVVGVPSQSWIRTAIDYLVQFRLAVRNEDDGTYTVLYRPLRGDLLKRFGKLVHDARGKIVRAPRETAQPMLFAESTTAST